MISCEFFYQLLQNRGIRFFSGVPDSLLKDFCAYLTAHCPDGRHVITANEGGAVGLACGVYLATGQIPMVYMQNSGQGNAMNPLVSLADPDVYAIPFLLLIGWRGQPGVHDEPQHKKQGKITLSLLDTLGLPYRVLPKDQQQASEDIDAIVALMKERQSPAALVVEKGTFEPYKAAKPDGGVYDLKRETAIALITGRLDPTDVIVSTTGKISRELFEYRVGMDGVHDRDFLTVGSMGHCSQIALGIALSKADRQVFCFDGDGAVIMHLGGVAVIGSRHPKNFKHVVLNNGCHDSVGGQPTCGFAIDIVQIARACGYVWGRRVETEGDLTEAVEAFKTTEGPALLEVRVRPGSRSDLGRPTVPPVENKERLMRFLSS